MDLFSLLFTTYGLVTLLVLLCSVFIYYKFGYEPYQYFKKQGIKGPKPKPFIGSLGLIKEFKGNTVEMNTYLVKTYGPISGIYFGTKPFLAVADLDMIKDITVKHFDKFVDRLPNASNLKIRAEGESEGKDFIFGLTSDEWRQRRHIISPTFSALKMKQMEHLIKDSSDRLVLQLGKHAESGKSVEVLNLYSKMTMEVILSAFFGRAVDIQGGEGGEIYENAKGAFVAMTDSTFFRLSQFFLISFPRLAPILAPLLRMAGMFKSIPRLATSAMRILELRRAETSDKTRRKDFLQMLIEAGDGKTKLSNGEIVAESVGFLLAGYETTSVALSFATHLLAQYPQAQEKLAAEIQDYFKAEPDKSMYDAAHEIDYLDMVVCETLRLYPPAASTIRLCNERCVINGIDITPGIQILLLTYDIHHDPDLYPEPEKFIPERFSLEEKASRHPCAYLAFGFGPRNCVGMRFALMQFKVALIELVRNFRIELAPGAKVPLETCMAAVLRPKNGVHVIFKKRS